MTSSTQSLREEDGSGFPIATSGSVLRPLKAAEVVARDVVRDIGRDRLRPGDSLESEAVMLERYGVSRESLREGLRLLEVQGLIAIRRGPGGGPVVGTVDPTNLGRVEALFFNLAGATYEELFDAWVLAETTLAERAARVADKSARVTAMAPYLSGEAHIDDRVLHLSFRAFGQLVAHHVATIGDPRTIGAVLESDHAKIASLIAAGRAKAASAAMREHLGEVVAMTREHFGDSLEGRIEWL